MDTNSQKAGINRLRNKGNVLSDLYTEIKQKTNELIKYIKWKNGDTIKVYEHYFDEEKHREAHDQLLENMAKLEKEYIEKTKHNRKKKLTLTVIESSKNIEIE